MCSVSFPFIDISLGVHLIAIILHLSKFIRNIENVGVVEWHMMPIATENDQVVLENYSRVAISCRRALALHVVNLGVTLCLPHHGRSILITAHGHPCGHGASHHCLALSHLLVVLVEVRSFVILDQERSFHMIRGWRVK